MTIDNDCVYLEDISDEETICKKGFPTSVACFTGEGCNCPYYSNYYDPNENEILLLGETEE